MLSPIHRMTARSRFRRRCPGIPKRAAVGCSSDAPFYRCIHLLPPLCPSALATVSGPFSRCHLACGEAHPVFNALLAVQDVGERLLTDAASVSRREWTRLEKGAAAQANGRISKVFMIPKSSLVLVILTSSGPLSLTV